MTNADFENKLKALKLTKRDFSVLCGAEYTGIAKWKQKGNTPNWVSSWLENYELAQKYKAIIANLPK